MSTSKPESTLEIQIKQITANYSIYKSDKFFENELAPAVDMQLIPGRTSVMDIESYEVAPQPIATQKPKIMELLVDSANKCDNGDLEVALQKFSDRLSSYNTNIRKHYTPDFPIKLLRYGLLYAFVCRTRTELKHVPGKPDQPYWSYTIEQIDEAFAAKDIKRLESIRNGMASKLSDYRETIPDIVAFEKRYAHVRMRYSELRNNETTVAIPDAIQAKLINGKALTAKEAVALAEILKIRKLI